MGKSQSPTPSSEEEQIAETSPEAGRSAAFNFIADRMFKPDDDEIEDGVEPGNGAADPGGSEEPEAGKAGAPEAKVGEGEVAAAGAGSDEPEEPKPKPTRRRKAKEFDENKLAEIVARATSEATAKIVKPEQRQDERPQEFTVPDEFADDADVYRTLAELYPEKYGYKSKERLDTKLQKYAEARQKYESEWKKEHPGEQFDISDEEHEDFVSENYPVIEEREIKQARRAYQEKLIEKKAEEKVAPIQREIATERYLKKITPVINDTQDAVVKSVVSAVDKDAVKYMSSPEEFAKMADEDPVLYQALQEAGPVFIPRIQTAIAVLSEGGDILYNDSDPVHQSIVRDIKRLHQAIVKSGDTQDEEGREYLPIPKYRSLPPDKRNDYWTIDSKFLVDVYSGKMQEAVQQRVSHLNSLFEKKMKVAKPGHSREQSKEQNQQARKPVSSGPSVRATGPVAGAGAPKTKPNETGVDLLLSRIFSGS